MNSNPLLNPLLPPLQTLHSLSARVDMEVQISTFLRHTTNSRPHTTGVIPSQLNPGVLNPSQTFLLFQQLKP